MQTSLTDIELPAPLALVPGALAQIFGVSRRCEAGFVKPALLDRIGRHAGGRSVHRGIDRAIYRFDNHWPVCGAVVAR